MNGLSCLFMALSARERGSEGEGAGEREGEGLTVESLSV